MSLQSDAKKLPGGTFTMARRHGSLDALGNVADVRHSDIIALCISTNEGIMRIVSGGLLDGIRP
jgi:hypothetical protein